MSMQYGDVYNCKKAEEYLLEHDNDYAVKLDMCIIPLLDNKDNWENIFEVEEEIKSKMSDVHALYAIPNAMVSFDCLLFNQLHDFFMPMVHKEFEESDEWYFKKALDLSDITAEQLGAPPEYAVPLLAAIVELANLDRHKSPVEKMLCLCTTYDFIFAELKAAIINTISKCSGKECDIPVINNSDIIPILITVIIKSKLIHLYSNFYYISTFFGGLNEDTNSRHVLNEFEVAIMKISKLSRNSLKPSSVDTNKNMDLCKFIRVTSDFQSKIRRNKNEMTHVDNHLFSVTELIVTSTNQNQLLPDGKG